MERWLNEVWYGAAPGAALLAPLAALYGAVTRLRRRAYDAGWLRSVRVGRPLVVVGNLTAGGSGKTPLVAWLAAQLGARGLRVGIASRGYGGAAGPPRKVETGSDWRDVGDEPLLLRERTGCLTVVSADRVAAARMLVAAGADVLVCDDGLQHLRLARDCEIVVVDGARGFGNGRLLPSGPLREPAERLAHADLVVFNGSPAPPVREAASTGAPVFTMQLLPAEARRLDGGAMRAIGSFAGQPVHAVAGIGNPARFFGRLREHGLQPIEHAFPDHHPFSAADLAFGDELPVLMTEKDAVKCRAFAGPRLWYVPVTADFGETQSRVLLDHVLLRLRIDAGEKR